MQLLKDKAYGLINQIEYDIDVVLENYEKYILAYCAELNVTECDILKDEDLFERTFHIFENISMKKNSEVPN
jgi:hypothetical protein